MAALPAFRKIILQVPTSRLKSAEFARVLCGLKPVPKGWLKKPRYE